MSKGLVATATASIAADKTKVWKALIAPEAIKQYMFGADVESDCASEARSTKVTLLQDNNPHEKSRAESEKNWNAMLEGLRKYAERTSHQSQ
jgi:hypothetical protein